MINSGIKYFITLSMLLLSFVSFSQEHEKIIKQMTKDLEHLASDKMKGREAGTKQEKDAADFIAKRFKEIGLFPLGDKGDYLQAFEFPKKENPHDDEANAEMLSGVNVVGYLDNGAKTNVIIGAHFDHLGMGGEGSLHETEAVHNGADDNASGVVAMIYMAERLKASNLRKNNYIFVAFTGEEKGLFGSNYFLKHPPFYLNTMNYMINLDMVGRLDSTKGIAINGVGTSPIWTTVISHGDQAKLKYKTSESGVGPSDHTSFYLKDIPALHFFTGSHEDYHRPTDDADKINYEGIIQVSDFIIDVIITDLNTKLKLAFTRTKDDDVGVPRFKVTLGVVPDYLFDGEGMRIEGVKEDKPGAKAGIMAGDIVIRIGETEVKDMKSYMIGLSTLEEGSKSLVKVRRDDKELEFEVQF